MLRDGMCYNDECIELILTVKFSWEKNVNQTVSLNINLFLHQI